MVNQQLMDILKFDEEDLEANRKGNLSEKQKKRLRKGASSHKNFGLVVGGILSIIALLPFAGMIWDRSFFSWSLLLGSIFCWVPIWGYLGFPMLMDGFKKQTAKFMKKQGPVQIATREYTAHKPQRVVIAHDLDIGGHKFTDVDDRLADVMTKGDVYTVYYVHYSVDDVNEIFSAELFEKAK